MMRLPVLTLVCAAGIGSAAAALRPREDVPVAVPAGPPVACIGLASIRETRVRNDRTIDFITRGRSPGAYRVTLPQDCPQLGFERHFAYATSLSQLCSTDIITVLQQAPLMRGASCGLAPFQPVTLPPRR